MQLSTRRLALFVPFCLAWACGGSSSGTEGGSGAGGGSTGISLAGTGAASGSDPGLGGSSSGGTTLVGAGGTTLLGTGGTLAAELCGDAGCICSNGIDDDEDGLIDGLDPECTSPLDNDEATYATGIPGDNRDPKWQDCFFDGNSGAGDDKCRYHTDCLTGDKAADDPDCELSAECIEFCGGRTPNGCDCFGCCTVSIGIAESVDILTGNDCSVDKAEDADACPPCVKSTACGNTCGECELCPGKTVADLPEACNPGTGGTGGGPGGPGYTCDGGEQVCGPDLAACSAGHFCSLGCCLVSPPR